MKLDRVQTIADAVLYEGYMLYPYRQSAVKNQQRWNFGVLCPRSYSELQNETEAWSMQTECLMESSHATSLEVTVRFLQIVDRTIGKLARPLNELPVEAEPVFDVVDSLEVAGERYVPWQEAVEREVDAPLLYAGTALLKRTVLFDFPAVRTLEPLRGENSMIVGVVIRESRALFGSVEINLKQCVAGISKVTVTVRNLTSFGSAQQRGRADALMDSLVSAHTIVALENGAFFSMIDPPENIKGLVDECRNLHTWPVLIGEKGDRDIILSSPIILYDYPKIAPESLGALFDGTEIDEILSLRILTLTEDEKREMRQSDQRTRQILERTENMPPEHFMKLHGALRGLRPAPQEAP